MNDLSKREREVAQLVLEGKSNKLIASALHITVSTVEFHLKNIYEKFQVSSRTELILKLGQSTVVDEGESAENRDGRILPNWFKSLREAVSKIGKEFRMNNVMNTTARDPESPLTFFESIRICLTKYADFTGRGSRPEFWWFALFVILVVSALVYLSEEAASIFLIAVLLPFLAAGARRLHDTGRSGWWQLFLLVPAAGFVLVGILWAQPPADPLPEER